MGKCYIQNINTGLVLDVKQSCTDAGTDVVMFAYHGGANQLWKHKNGMLCSVLDKKMVLDIDMANRRLCLHHAHGGPNQQWTFNGDNTISSGTGDVVDIRQGSTDSGAALIPWSRHGGPNQCFRLVEA